MIQFTKTTNGFIVEFSDNELFLDEGKISLPLNSLSLTIDESDIATFRKSGNNDVFFSGIISNIIFDETAATKQNIAGLFSNTCCLPPGGGPELEERVTALEDTVGDSNSGLVHDVNDLDDSVSTLSSSVGALQTTVGDSTAGLVHDVTGLSSSVSSLQTTVGDSNSGLVKDVDDLDDSVSTISSSVSILQSTVGDNNSGLVKDVDDLNNSVSTMSSTVTSLQTTVGNSNSGLVKDVNDLETTIIDDERVTAEALTELRRMIGDITDTLNGLNLRLTEAESEITTLDTVMSAAVNQLS